MKSGIWKYCVKIKLRGAILILRAAWGRRRWRGGGCTLKNTITCDIHVFFKKHKFKKHEAQNAEILNI